MSRQPPCWGGTPPLPFTRNAAAIAPATLSAKKARRMNFMVWRSLTAPHPTLPRPIRSAIAACLVNIVGIILTMNAKTIYTASDLKERRTEILDAAQRGRVLVRAVDGTALVFTELTHLERQETVARWAIALHHVRRGNVPTDLHWVRHLDDEDRASFLDEAIDMLEDVAAGGKSDSFEEMLGAWRATALSLADTTRRRILLGHANDTDFVEATRPGGTS